MQEILAIKDILNAKDANVNYIGVTGFDSVDSHFSGFRKSDLCLVASSCSILSFSFTIKILHTLLFRHRCKILFFSFNKFAGELVEDISKLCAEDENLDDKELYIVDERGLNIRELIARADMMFEVDAIVIDDISGIFDYWDKRRSKIFKKLKSYAVKHNILVIVSGMEEKKVKNHKNADLMLISDRNCLGRCCDTIFFLDDSMTTDDGAGVWMSILRSRIDGSGLSVLFDYRHSQFHEY